MFFGSVTLSKKSWHYRLQELTYGRVFFRNNFCPYFWLTMASLLLLPITAIRWTLIGLLLAGTFVFYIFYSLAEKLADLLGKYICMPYISKAVSEYVDEMNDADAYAIAVDLFGETSFLIKDGSGSDYFGSLKDRDKDTWLIGSDESDKERQRKLLWWKEWKRRAGDNWETRVRQAHDAWLQREEERYALQQKLDAAQEAVDLRRKAFFNGLVKYTKYVMLLVGGIATIFLLYWLAVLALTVVENWSSFTWFFGEIWLGIRAFTKGFVWLLILCVPALMLYGLIVFAIKIIRNCNFIKMPKLLRKVGGGIWSVVDFFVMFIKTFKANNCPAIEWKKDD